MIENVDHVINILDIIGEPIQIHTTLTMLSYVFNLASSFTKHQMDNIFPNSKFKTIYWYGERYYCAAEVDAHINTSGTGSNPQPLTPTTCMRSGPPMYVKGSELFPLAHSCMKVAQARRAQLETQATEANLNSNTESGVSATDYWNAIANDGTMALSSPTRSPSPCKPAVMQSGPADSPHSVTSSASTGGGGVGASSRGRAIGKRNQEFYLPDGGVRLSHISTGCDAGEGQAWFGKYDKKSNTIIRTLDANTDTAIAVYETLAHFAQEHDHEVNQTDARDTPNVWKNQLFTFYNTVTCRWEPLSSLRE